MGTMRSGASARTVAALLAAVCCASCSATDDALPAVPATTGTLGASQFRDAAVELVEQRDAALRGGDRDAFMATVDDDELLLPVDFTMHLDGFEQHSVTQRLLYTFRARAR